MPTYKFALRDGRRAIEDEGGVTLPDDVYAFRYARQIAAELMTGREKETRTWLLDVYDEDGGHILELPFARIDRTLDHVVPELRAMIEQICERKRALGEAIYAAQATARESRALMALARGKPYLATLAGEKTIRNVPSTPKKPAERPNPIARSAIRG
jgi:hypothetical protein